MNISKQTNLIVKQSLGPDDVIDLDKTLQGKVYHG